MEQTDSVSVDAVMDFLERERAALTDGRFDELEGLATEKERLSRALAEKRLDAETLVEVRRTAERNAVLLEAAARGLRSVVRRVRALRDAQKPLETYSRDGVRRTLSAGTGHVGRKV
ncbi:MAG: hypothetical protein AAFR35_13315 [Pseudomonadota bacterium]